MSCQKTNKVLKQRIALDIISKLWSINKPLSKNLPIGVSDFIQLSTKYSEFYVDKTNFIKNILEFANVGMKMIVITRPPGWGKSVNISMLKYFFSRHLDINGELVTPSPFRNIFFGGGFSIQQGRNFKEIELSPLKISGLKTYSNFALSRSVLGSASIIFLEFGKIQGNNYVQIKRSIVKQIKNAYENHQYIKYTDKPSLFCQLFKQIERIQDLSNQILVNEPIDLLLKNLVSILDGLKKFGENRCYIFIDDFDEPVNKVISKGLSEAKGVAQLIYDLLYPIFEITKNLRIVAVGKINIFQNFVSEYQQFHIFQDKFYEDFGFVQTEVKSNILQNFFYKMEGKTQAMVNFFLKKIVREFGGYICSKYSPLKIHPSNVFRFLQYSLEKNEILPNNMPFDLLNNWFFERFFSLNCFGNIFEYHNTREKQQRQLTLQFLISPNNKDISGAQINSIAYSYGLVTGNLETVGKWKIRNSRFPNASTVRAIQNQVKNRLSSQFDFVDFSQVDLQSVESICQKFELMLKCLYDNQIEVNKKIIQTAFYYRYKYSMGTKWLPISDLVEQFNGIPLNVFGPKYMENEIYFVSFCYFPSQQLKQQLLPQVVLKELQGNKLDTLIEFGKLFGYQIEQYVIRFISVIPNRKIQLYSVSSLCPDLQLNNIQIQNIAFNMKKQKIKYQCDRIRKTQKIKKFETIFNLISLLGSRKFSQSQSLQELFGLWPNRKKRMGSFEEIKKSQKKFKRKSIEM